MDTTNPTADPIWLRNLRSYAGTGDLHAESVRATAMHAAVEIDRLRAELAETRSAGDKLARVASELYAFTSTDAHRGLDRARLIEQVRAWESLR